MPNRCSERHISFTYTFLIDDSIDKNSNINEVHFRLNGHVSKKGKKKGGGGGGGKKQKTMADSFETPSRSVSSRPLLLFL